MLEFLSFINDVKNGLISFFQSAWDIVSSIITIALDLMNYLWNNFTQLFEVIGYLPVPVATTFYIIIFLTVAYGSLNLVKSIKDIFF